jgi:ribosomal protein S18 acetylase RimI-like enzyme
MMFKFNFRKLFLLFVMFSAKPVFCAESRDKEEILEIAKSWLRSLSDPQEDSPKAFAWFYPVAHPRFNAILHFSHSENVEGHLDALIGRALPLAPIAFWVDPENSDSKVIEALKTRGFISSGCYPAMSWDVQPIDLPKLEVRKADLDLFHDILGICLHYNEEVKQGSLNLLREKDGEHYIIYLDEKPVGTGTLFVKNGMGMVAHIATLPDYQKRGIGRAMMQYIMNKASERGLKKLILYSSHVAEKLYQNLGFQKVGEAEIYIRENR